MIDAIYFGNNINYSAVILDRRNIYDYRWKVKTWKNGKLDSIIHVIKYEDALKMAKNILNA